MKRLLKLQQQTNPTATTNVILLVFGCTGRQSFGLIIRLELAYFQIRDSSFELEIGYAIKCVNILKGKKNSLPIKDFVYVAEIVNV